MLKICRVFKRIVRNISYIIHHDIGKEIYETKCYVSELREKQMRVYDSLFLFYNWKVSSLEFREEKEFIEREDYIIKTHDYKLIPYPNDSIVINVQCGMNEGYPYVLHRDKRLYFPSSWSLERACSFYQNYIENERITNTKNDYPHQYQTENFKIEPNDVVVDLGCAEALLVLDVIDKVSKAYLVECESEWEIPLKMTFKDYNRKVVYVNKYISNFCSNKTITLSELLKDETSPLFIKMDIEGAEVDVLSGSKEFLSTRKKVKIACCTYHRVSDAATIGKLLSEIGYSCSLSHGFVLTSFLDRVGIPTLRKGVIRAIKI